uniref:Uncharacterized protein n=1 Tax=Caenorhabditis japonica TaxID=281687 RepID=A0A8R1DFC1_CAEJA
MDSDSTYPLPPKEAESSEIDVHEQIALEELALLLQTSKKESDAAVRMRRKRQIETPEESAIRKKKDRESKRLRRAAATEKEKEIERICNAQSKMDKRLCETLEKAEERRESLRRYAKAKRESETKEQRAERLKYHAARYRKKRDEKIANEAKEAFGGATVTRHHLGQMTTTCTNCSARFFKDETSKDVGIINICCAPGDIEVKDNVSKFSVQIEELLTGYSPDADNFQSNMRQFNLALTLASMGVKVEDFSGHGPLHPPTGKAPSYGQLYIMNTKQAAEERLNVAPNKNCDISIMKSLSKLLAEINAKSYKTMFEVENEGERLDVTDQPVRKIFDINAAELNKNILN